MIWNKGREKEEMKMGRCRRWKTRGDEKAKYEKRSDKKRGEERAI